MKNNSNNTLFYIFTSFLLLMIVVFNYYFSSPIDEKLNFSNVGTNTVGNGFIHSLSANGNNSNSIFTSHAMNMLGTKTLPVYKFKGQYYHHSSISTTAHQVFAENTIEPSSDNNSVLVQSESQNNTEDASNCRYATQIDVNVVTSQIYAHQNVKPTDVQFVNIDFNSLGGLFAQQAISNEVYLKDNSFNTNNTLSLTTEITGINTALLVDGDGDPGDPGNNQMPVGDGVGFLLFCMTAFVFVKRKNSPATTQS